MEYILSIIEESNRQILMLEAQVGGFTGQSFNVQIDIVRKSARYTSYDYGFRNEAIKDICLTEGGLKEFIYMLYKLRVENWKKHYSTKEIIMDGTNWLVKLVTDKCEYESEGNNAYPTVWHKFCKCIEGLIKEEFR